MKSIFTTAITGLILFAFQSFGQKSVTNPLKANQMKQFSLLVRVPLTYTTEQAKSVNPRWDALLDQWKADSTYIISFPFPGESYVVSGAEKTVKKESVISENRRVVSNLFIRAANIEAAVELAKDCPILEFGGTVEVREIPVRPVKTDAK